jgi:hypothetical protein
MDRRQNVDYIYSRGASQPFVLKQSSSLKSLKDLFQKSELYNKYERPLERHDKW